MTWSADCSLSFSRKQVAQTVPRFSSLSSTLTRPPPPRQRQRRPPTAAMGETELRQVLRLPPHQRAPCQPLARRGLLPYTRCPMISCTMSGRRQRTRCSGSCVVKFGHQELLAAGVKAAAATGANPLEGAFELTVQNADKGLLSAEEIRRRVAQFVALGLPVVVTRAPLFTNKADLLPGSRFVVGYDTAARLVLPKYYGNSYTQMLLDFSRLRQNGCSFIVAGRKDALSGRFLSLADVDMVPELADLFPISLPEETFRLDISSTELRQKAQVQ
ncbi:hypothetical protein Vretimale_6798 [Volvox reticuliferus]|uniref:Uncharacterized protein n=1 Tax=Volvox reticuliferus TaxID=1737510 RepID=A0A8J4LMQ6_9CHLO|nr:hypothetical protein Vretimale_6798 [Volvox reticuliferus]